DFESKNSQSDIERYIQYSLKRGGWPLPWQKKIEAASGSLLLQTVPLQTAATTLLDFEESV
uniref:hypothetical protein n=1 Tax=Salmonella sp. s55004 TaxID=3159675 RepID=UPI00397EA22B